jgi:hypothetical protein
MFGKPTRHSVEFVKIVPAVHRRDAPNSLIAKPSEARNYYISSWPNEDENSERIAPQNKNLPKNAVLYVSV